MLWDLEEYPLLLVIASSQSALMLEDGASCLRRWINAPLIRRGELLDTSSLYEGSNCMFEDGSCCKGSYGVLYILSVVFAVVLSLALMDMQI